MRRFLFVMLILAVPAWGQELNGQARQGGIMWGRVQPGQAVSLDGRSVPVDEHGRFLLGFGRDALALAVLTVDGRDSSIAVAPSTWVEQRIDGLPEQVVNPDPAGLARLAEDNRLMAERRRQSDPVGRFWSGLVRPAEGRVSGVFGSRRILNGQPRAPHSGLDIAGPVGTVVRTCADGVVRLVHPDMLLTGVTVLIDHGLGLASVYAHLSRADVQEGEQVSQGQVIGAMGATGRVSGPHLHFGLSWLDVRLDPEQVLDSLSVSR